MEVLAGKSLQAEKPHLRRSHVLILSYAIVLESRSTLEAFCPGQPTARLFCSSRAAAFPVINVQSF